MESSILVMDAAAVNLQGLHSGDNEAADDRQQGKFGDVLDDQLHTQEVPANNDQPTQNQVVAQSQAVTAPTQAGELSLDSKLGVKDPDVESTLDTEAVAEVGAVQIEAMNLDVKNPIPGPLAQTASTGETELSALENTPALATSTNQVQSLPKMAIVGQANPQRGTSSQVIANVPLSVQVNGDKLATTVTDRGEAKLEQAAVNSAPHVQTNLDTRAQTQAKSQVATTDHIAQAASPVVAQEINDQVHKLRSIVENPPLNVGPSGRHLSPGEVNASAANAGPFLGGSTSSQSGFGTVLQSAGQGAALPQMLPDLAHPLGDPQWNQAFSQRIVWALGQGIQAATLALNPSELGPVTVQISIHDDEAILQFNALHGQAREAIAGALPRLRDMLQSSGIVVAQADVSGDAQTQSGQGGAQQQRHEFSSQYSPGSGDESDVSSVAAVQRSTQGLIDTFV